MDRDELARVIDPHAFAHWEGMVAHCLRTGDSQEDAERWATTTYGPNMDAARDQADAVLAYFREYLGRDETVEVAARAHCDYFGGEGWWEIGLLADTLPEGRKAMIAALSSAIGQPETEFSGWVEVVEEGKR